MSPRRSFNWHGFKDLLDHLEAARPRITDKARLRTNAVFGSVCDAECFEGLKPDAEASISEEPGAIKPHARICAGTIGSPVVLRRWPLD
jgi:hypothetical protein